MIQLRSFSRLGVALVMAPFGLIGVVAALLITGTQMGFVAELGEIAFDGMITRNAVILIEEADGNAALGMGPEEAARAATLKRLRPILLTALAAILGMVPISLQIFWGPMAYAMIGESRRERAPTRREHGAFEGRRRAGRRAVSSQSSRMATARVKPADAPLIFTGKQLTVKPSGGRLSRFASFSMWQ